MTYSQEIIALFGATAFLLVAIAAGVKVCTDACNRFREAAERVRKERE